MVSKLRILVVWPLDRGGGICDLELTLAPIILPSPSAANIYAGIFHHPTNRHILAGREVLFSLAEHGIDVSESDGAGSNYKLEAHLAGRRTEGSVAKEHFVCRLHGQHLIEGVTLGTAGTRILSRLYSWTLLMKTSGNWMRMMAAVAKAFSEIDYRRLAWVVVIFYYDLSNSCSSTHKLFFYGFMGLCFSIYLLHLS